MSERNSKKNKKANPIQVQKPQKTQAEKTATIIMAVVILVVTALGGWAIYDTVKKQNDIKKAQEYAQEQARLAAENNVRALAIQQGISTEELLKKIGLENSGLTETSTQEELWEKLTIESYAKLNNLDVNEFKTMFGLEALDNGMLWTEAEKQITMGKIAEVEYGMDDFEQFALEQELPEGVTAETTLGEYDEIREALAAAEAEAKAKAEAEAEAEEPAEQPAE